LAELKKDSGDGFDIESTSTQLNEINDSPLDFEDLQLDIQEGLDSFESNDYGEGEDEQSLC
jgi:hypothetical protein